jgi:DNA-directed RNA polymerase specialized sigma24 family protein
MAFLLHLVDENGHPAHPSIQAAVEAAFRWISREYRQFDRALLAGMAESVALAMSRRVEFIELPRRYAFTALTGKVHEWYRAHPKVEVVLEPTELEQLGGSSKEAISAANLSLLFAEVKRKLSDRDRQILVLMEQDRANPKDIARVFDISYRAAAKALQRARGRIRSIIFPKGNQNANDELIPRPHNLNPKKW